MLHYIFNSRSFDEGRLRKHTLEHHIQTFAQLTYWWNCCRQLAMPNRSLVPIGEVIVTMTSEFRSWLSGHWGVACRPANRAPRNGSSSVVCVRFTSDDLFEGLHLVISMQERNEREMIFLTVDWISVWKSGVKWFDLIWVRILTMRCWILLVCQSDLSICRVNHFGYLYFLLCSRFYEFVLQSTRVEEI